ncbi:protein-methionine-sulfoxide reductase catalytic subunit MsrP [Opitutus sp. ER46]|uniref:protein-methionine-sulfoxide reductase catalytic subunit MsrP n=1 Tax=Opitutus sp. ER46 TaxID=2161864 RepID=UPI000D31D742|nr:protein-methionine-sulfoxide reductase catalytic subunit MsrP [Opitutus sp. ER46]PTX95495.1 protein-methionine-sulfoxide reductase catalytic subunit MsrP [Opitutus sp. ER46]
MLIRSPKSWELPESAATPEADYAQRPRSDAGPARRDFLKTLGLGLAATSLLPPALRAATAGFPAKVNRAYRDPELKPTPYELITSYNNFYEFGTDKSDPVEAANKGWKTEPWTVELAGLCRNPAKIDVNDLIAKVGGLEQRVYRFRCVEAWSMVIPWDGFPLAKLVALADPTEDAKYVKFTTVLDPKNIPGQRTGTLDWPYVEGLRLDEARHDLAFIATGIYGRAIPNQNGAPLRLVVPWKYGFKGIKSIVKVEFVAKQPRNTWNVMAAREYGFFANVNPKVDHPRWSQASERVIGAGGALGRRQRTLMFNGYEKEVAALYQGMDLAKFY